MNALQASGTNRYGMKIAAFTTMDGTGATKLLAVTALRGESEEDFTWAGQRFENYFREPPRVLLTDNDPAMKAAFRKVWPSPRTKHDLCIWHLGKCVNILQTNYPKGIVHRCSCYFMLLLNFMTPVCPQQCNHQLASSLREQCDALEQGLQRVVAYRETVR